MENIQIALIAIVVDEYDDAVFYYTKKLNFKVIEDKIIEDKIIEDKKRWVVLSPNGSKNCNILLTKAVKEDEKDRVGNQIGGGAIISLETDDFQRDYINLMRNSVPITIEPTIKEPYGKFLAFEDLYGNIWNLTEPLIQQKG
ncbi:VOC family protein [Flavobacterium plurextorum]|uniref:VOC family protein n=1 Tax=Flavobacterium TaxID=237 RepID=UPI00214DBCE7|nr:MULTISPECIES: VOC family protein [Flavobacterium]UUW08429.1 VOC family protein [Flavobacterium plurextorum]